LVYTLWIRIRIQEGKNNSQKEITVKKFHVLTSEMLNVLFGGRGGLSCSLKEVHVGLGNKLMHLLIKKLKIANCQFLEFLFINNQDSDPDSPQSLDPDQVSEAGSETLSTGI
jgi:hypothetical protein